MKRFESELAEEGAPFAEADTKQPGRAEFVAGLELHESRRELHRLYGSGVGKGSVRFSSVTPNLI